ncbi:hypothetical protein [Rhodococcus rhodochrous]|uniref:hypothetical protein n=1 Tax=Rhodococcus rhodochrous TaxID=1829 RepID=UPI000FF031DA
MHTGSTVSVSNPNPLRPARDPRERLRLGEKYDDNRPKVDMLSRVYSGAVVVFLVEIAALILDLMNR